MQPTTVALRLYLYSITETDATSSLILNSGTTICGGTNCPNPLFVKAVNVRYTVYWQLNQTSNVSNYLAYASNGTLVANVTNNTIVNMKGRKHVLHIQNDATTYVDNVRIWNGTIADDPNNTIMSTPVNNNRTLTIINPIQDTKYNQFVYFNFTYVNTYGDYTATNCTLYENGLVNTTISISSNSTNSIRLNYSSTTEINYTYFVGCYSPQELDNSTSITIVTFLDNTINKKTRSTEKRQSPLG